MNNFIITILSIFVPERITLDNDLVKVLFLNKTINKQKLISIVSLSFIQKHDFTGGQILIVRTEESEGTYFADQIGFSNLVKYIFERNGIREEIAQDLLNNNWEDPDFFWERTPL